MLILDHLKERNGRAFVNGEQMDQAPKLLFVLPVTLS